MEQNNNQNFIKTTTELKQYIGKYVVCYYYDNWEKDKISFQWLFKVSEKNNQLMDDETIAHNYIFGENCVCLVDNQHANKIAPYFMNNETEANAQDYIRIPTQEEMKKYMHIMRRKRIFGK